MEDFFKDIKKSLNKLFELKDNKIFKGSSTYEFLFRIDYHKVKNSNLFKSNKVINDFNL